MPSVRSKDFALLGATSLLWVAALGVGWAWLGDAPYASPQAAEVPRLQGPVNDYADVLANWTSFAHNELLTLHRDTGIQWVVLTVPSLGGERIAAFTQRVMKAWRLGEPGTDLGLLLLLVCEDRQARLEVGYGLEGAIPDAIAKRWLTEVLAGSGSRAVNDVGYNVYAVVAQGGAYLRRQQALGLLPEHVAPKLQHNPRGRRYTFWGTVRTTVLDMLVIISLLILYEKFHRLFPEKNRRRCKDDGDSASGGGDGSSSGGSDGGYSGGGGDSGGGGASGHY